MVLLRVCVTPVHAAQSLVGCARSHLRREQPGGDANRGKNKGFSCEKERVCAAFSSLSRIRFDTADGRGETLDRRRSVRLTLFCTFCLFAIWSERFYALPINESKQRLRPSHAGVIKRSLLLRSYSVGSHATETPIRSRSHWSVEPDWAGPFRTDDLLIKFILPLGI